MNISTIAIVGAGLSGLVCAGRLAQDGFEVTLFDKGRHVGGRLASRDRDKYTFDYGAQYFTVRDPSFKKFVALLEEENKAALWQGNFGKIEEGELKEDPKVNPRYVGVPLMRTLTESLAQRLDCQMQQRITSVKKTNGKWVLTGTNEKTPDKKSFDSDGYDFLVLNMPPVQAATLHAHPGLNDFSLRPCIALMLAFEERVNCAFDGIISDDTDISWMARDSSKPGRKAGERWVIHGAPGWSDQNFNRNPQDIENELREKFATLIGVDLPKHVFVKSHKWKFALPASHPEIGCIFEKSDSLAYCGDWCEAGRVEGAYLSGLRTAEEIEKLAGR